MGIDLLEKRFTQAEVLAVTKLRPDLLQAWVNRGVVEVGERNPGSGRRRLYSAVDVVKLALLRRIADLGLNLDIGRDLAREAERLLVDGRQVQWELHLVIRRLEATEQPVKVRVVASAGHSDLSLKYNAVVGDARGMVVSMFTEPPDYMASRRTRTWGFEDRPIDPARREAFGRAGVHAEPALIFPFGEIVNGALLQVEALAAGGLPSVAEAMLANPADRPLPPGMDDRTDG